MQFSIYVDGYNLFRSDIDILTRILKHLNYAIQLLKTITPEYFIVEILQSGLTNILFGVEYRRPTAVKLSKFVQSLSNCLPFYDQVICAGNFKSKLRKNYNSDSLIKFAKSASIHIVESVPTHHRMTKKM